MTLNRRKKHKAEQLASKLAQRSRCTFTTCAISPGTLPPELSYSRGVVGHGLPALRRAPLGHAPTAVFSQLDSWPRLWQPLARG
jgi:hypothetical protein